MSNIVIDTLLTKRDQLKLEQDKMNERFNQEISDIETSLETISGKKVTDLKRGDSYDDENPDYVRQSIEEI